ncbi:unnamed protein product, partial [Pylaiella littoralis]
QQAILAAFELSREPGRQMLAVFDNSTGHAAFSPDALRAQNIAAGVGGEQAIPKDFEYDGRTIYTTFREGDVLIGVAKGMKEILEDMKLYRLLGEKKAPLLDGGGAHGSGSSRRCCCRWIISQVQAFKDQMNRVEELFEAAGHVCIFLAK